MMTDYLNEEYCEFSNDASASSFGWNFQSNAGIFLFLKYIHNALDIKIESKLQDIEITLVDGSKIFAQAKSAQDYTVAKDKKEKFKDAIVSLSRNPQNNNQLIYISNIPDTFKSANNYFDNSIVSYSSCLSNIKKEIDNTFQSTISSIEKKIKKERIQERKNKLIKIKKNVERFDKSSLFISTINPYFGDEENRYIKISDTVISFLVDCIKLNRDDAISIKQRLLEHWQLRLEYNSTVSDKSDTKKITKADFAWPIAAFLIDNDLSEISDCLSFTPDKSIFNDVNRIMGHPTSIYHERFEFSNRVLQEFEQFKKEIYGKGITQVEKEFIKQRSNQFIEEFRVVSDENVTEYLAKAFLFRIINNNRNMQKISAGVGVRI
ncbi:MAG: hypothetical protein E7247_03015 [Paenibacillaceae bacterium]|nr:hypothetical protein [Paenibacillaceae bacterium]